MAKHADEPLCPKCGEDRNAMVTAIRDGRRVVWFCAVCGYSWEEAPR
jgi:ribosomal protein L37AE/L43A